ncbi:MAG: RemA, partial [Bacteroidota bacterium]
SGTNLSYQWYANTTNSTINASLISSATSASYTPPAIAGTMYYFVVIHGDCGVDAISAVAAVEISADYTWNGSVSSDWHTAQNWTPSGVPTEIDHIQIPNCTNAPLNSNLTIACGGSVTLLTGGNLTLTGSIHNEGTLTLENKATLVQNGIGINTGQGTYNVKQAISGSGAAAPNGRFWYLGSPIANSVSQQYNAETTTVLKYFNEPTGAWIEINNATTPIEVGKGYFVQTGAIDTIEFIGGAINNGDYLVPCTRTGTTNYYRGYNLVSNPYASYVDFDAVTKTNVLATMWYRTADQMQTMVFDTYNSMNGIGTSVSGEAVTNFIAPMQSFWVKIPDGFTTGEIGFTNQMRSHYSIGFEGLKNKTNSYPVFIRLNLLDDSKKDQLIVLMDTHLNRLVDEFDSEKMMVSAYPQLYTTIGSSNLVINALPVSKLRTIVPITVSLPSSKTYQLQLDELNLENATLTLEDRQENFFQDLSINPCYTFYGAQGLTNNRFVLHINTSFGTTTTGFENESNAASDIFEPVIFQHELSGDILICLKDPLESNCQISIYDMSGKLVYFSTLNELETMLHLSEGPGIYYIEIEHQHLMYRKKITIF